MVSRRSRSGVLLGAFLALLGFFFPLYSSFLLSPDLARGPLEQSVNATSNFLALLRYPAFRSQIQGVAWLIPLCILFYWLLLLLALLNLKVSMSAFRSFSTAARMHSILCATLGLVMLCLLLSHTLYFIAVTLAFAQRKVATPLTLWDLLHSLETPLFWRFLFLFCTSSSFGVWLPLLGFLTILGLNGVLKLTAGSRETSEL